MAGGRASGHKPFIRIHFGVIASILGIVMKTLGIIGGIAPESTVEYYRQVIATYRTLRLDGSYPPLILNSIDLKTMWDMIAAGQLAEVTDFLSSEIKKLAQAGADFGLLASNTPHIVFDELQRRSSIPLISIVESAATEVKKAGLQRVGLFGTRFVTEGRFYPDVFARAGISVIAPTKEDREFIHDKYVNELIPGRFLPETRMKLLDIVKRMQAASKIEGLILGGTELPLLLRDSGDTGIPFLDTTRIHVEAAVKQMLA